MKHVKQSFIFKLLLLMLSFSFGLLSAYESCYLLSYINRYSPSISSFEETDDFGSLYLKYLERVCVYVKYKEAGYQMNPSSIYSSSDLVSMLSGTTNGNLKPNTSVYEFTQDSFEYYNRLVNIDCTNYMYYIKNLDTGEYMYSPKLPELLGNQVTIDDNKIEEYLKKISKKPSYLVLSTNNSLYSTNIESSSFYYSKSSTIPWCINFLNINANEISPGKDSANQRDIQTDKQVYLNTEIETQSSLINDSFESIDDTYAPITSKSSQNYIIYTFYDSSLPYENGQFAPLKESFDEIFKHYHLALYLCPISLVLCAALALLFLACVGHTKKDSTIYLNFFDRMYLEFAIILIGIFLVLPFAYLFLVVYPFKDIADGEISFFSIINYLGMYTLSYTILALFVTTLFKRIKSNTLIDKTLTFKLIRSFFHFCSNFRNLLITNFNVGFYLLLTSLLFVLLQLLSYIFLAFHYSLLYLIFVMFLILAYVASICKTYFDLNRTLIATKKIVNGDLDTQIHTSTMVQPVRELASDINNIRDGLSKAVDSQIKSERLKTELITNVSHDIKTPLTSIINYVDLLSKLDITDEKAVQYLSILKEKSWRLKTLIEDLVEASKASAGSITLHLEKIDLAELVRQSIGEFEDRLLEHELEPVLELSEEHFYILADGRCTYRIIENLLSNVVKYALPKTRVYMQICKKNSFAEFEIKNISSTKLGMNSDELIERFARGDISRNTEGSGLGLSIANSLATLQHGSFDLKIDGDLFKAILSLPQVISTASTPPQN